MKKKFLAALLVLCLVFSLLPMGALAEDEPEPSYVTTDTNAATVSVTVGDKTTYYTSFVNGALPAAKANAGAKVKLLKSNISVAYEDTWDDFEIDTNGYVFIIKSDADLTLESGMKVCSTAESKGTKQDKALFEVIDGGTLNIKGGTYTSTCAELIKAWGAVNIEDGTFTSTKKATDGAALLQAFGKDGDAVAHGIITMTGGTIDVSATVNDGAALHPIVAFYGGTLVLGTEGDGEKGPEIKGGYLAIGGNNTMDPVSVTINSGTYSTALLSGDNGAVTKFDSVIFASPRGDYQINGGKFTAFTGGHFVSVPYQNTQVDMTISGGDSTGDIYMGNENGVQSGTPKLTVTDGTFGVDVGEYVAPGYSCVAGATEGTYGIVKGIKNEAALRNALAADGVAEVKLDNDIAVGTSPVESSGKHTLDLNGKTLTVAEDNTGGIIKVVAGNLTINDSGKTHGNIDASGAAYAVGVYTGAGCIIDVSEDTVIKATAQAVYVHAGTASIKEGIYTVTTAGPPSAAEANRKYFVLNCQDTNYTNGDAKISVEGGMFNNFNPAEPKTETDQTVSFVATGFASTKKDKTENDWVVAPKSLEVAMPELAEGAEKAEIEIGGEYTGAADANKEEEVDASKGSVVFTLYTKEDADKNKVANESVKDVEVAILPVTIQSMVDNSVSNVTLKTDVADVKLNKTALKKLAGETDTVSITVTTKNDTPQSPSEGSAKATYEISIKNAAGESILPRGGDANGSIDITVPAPDNTAAKWWAYYVNEAGKRLEKFNTTLDDGLLTWTTTHLSNYALYDTEEALEPGDNGIKLTLDPDGGSLGDLANEMVVDKDSPVGELPTPTRSGYKFSGWYYKDETTNKSVKVTGDTTFSVDTTLTARWGSVENIGGGISTTNVTVPSAVGGKVSVSDAGAKKGDTVTVTATPDSGKAVGAVTVTDDSGKELAVTDAGDGKYTFVMPDGKVTVKVTFVDAAEAGPAFTDVPEGEYYTDAVAWAVAKGITTGTTATTFSPNASCTRAQMVTFLWRLAGSPKAEGTNPFADVDEGSYYYDAVLWAVANGITNGTGADTFSPDATVDRAQSVTFLYRYAGQPEVTSAGSFADVDAGAYYADAVNWAAANGITTGTTATTFSPGSDCVRAQIVTFMYRYAG